LKQENSPWAFGGKDGRNVVDELEQHTRDHGTGDSYPGNASALQFREEIDHAAPSLHTITLERAFRRWLVDSASYVALGPRLPQSTASSSEGDMVLRSAGYWTQLSRRLGMAAQRGSTSRR
jgi:hypothetical protein